MVSRSTKPMFWRDSRMPYVELRKIDDGRHVCYASHSHNEWSIGAITGGQSTFIYREEEFPVGAGTLVLMNPHWAHACNPVSDEPWAYFMLYVDTPWLTQLRYDAGLLETLQWQDIDTAVITEAVWYEGYCQMVECLLDPKRELLEKQTVVVDYLSSLMHELSAHSIQQHSSTPDVLWKIAAYLDKHVRDDVSLDTLCEHSDYSPGHLIRTFKQYFGLTPHAYHVNRRVQLGQRELKEGKPIVEAALGTGFSDQPHFTRTFKRLVGATPNEYRETLLNNQVDTTAGKQDSEYPIKGD